MTLSISAIDAALFARLQELGPAEDSGNGTFKLVGRFTGEPRPEALDAETLARNPAALLALEGEDPFAAQSSESLLGDATDQGRIFARVYLVLRESRGTTKATKGATSTAGIYDLIDAVIAQLNRMTITDAAYVGQVRWIGWRHVLTQPGSVYVWMVRFSVDRALPGADDVTAEVDLLRVETNINVDPSTEPDGTDPPLNPIVQTSNDF